jgi:hypothetical protein
MKEWIIGIILVVLFAYYLGITIASVVDYRLKDAIINLPEQNNTIYLKVGEEHFEVEKDDYKTKKKITNLKKKNLKTSKSSKKSSKKNKKFEHFEQLIKENKDDTIIDQNQKAYAISYKLAKSLQNNTLPFNGYNSYDYDQVYSTFEK